MNPGRAFTVWFLRRSCWPEGFGEPRIIHMGIRWEIDEPPLCSTTWNYASKILCGLAAVELAGIEEGWRSRWDAVTLPPPGTRVCQNCSKAYTRLEHRLGLGVSAGAEETNR